MAVQVATVGANRMIEDANRATPRPLSFPGENVVLLPCEPEQFQEFITGLFGRPQSVERFIGDPFEVTKAKIINVHHLLEQRISPQNENSLMSFSARVEYNDGSTVTTNSVQDWASYAEIRPLISLAVTVQWTYLVRFLNKAVPEKQEIVLTFSSPRVLRHYDFKDFIMDGFRASGINYRINYTDRGWGSDMDTLLNAHLRTLTKAPSRLERLLYRRSTLVGGLFGSAITAGCIASCFFAVRDLADKLSREVSSINAKATLSAKLMGRIEYLSKLETAGTWTKLS